VHSDKGFFTRQEKIAKILCGLDKFLMQSGEKRLADGCADMSFQTRPRENGEE